MCLYPKLILNPKYKSNKKNRGIIPPIKDERVKYVPIGCKKCMECRKQVQREWQVRLSEEIRHNQNAKFITLTFSNESIQKLQQKIHEETRKNDQQEIPTAYDLDNAIATRATRLFLENWRKKYKKSLRHWLVTELGHNGTENIHLHGIIWTEQPMENVEKKWTYGHIWKGKKIGNKIINYVNEKTINYITKYVNKIDKDHKGYNSIILCSPGIGKDYTKRIDFKSHKFNNEKTIETYRTRTGTRIALPIYYRNKAFTEEQREQLWLYKLNKEERWILGNKVSIKNNNYTYYDAMLKRAQQINKEFKYGDDTKNWKQEQYERERRILIQKKRIQKTYNNNKKEMAKGHKNN